MKCFLIIIAIIILVVLLEVSAFGGIAFLITVILILGAAYRSEDLKE